MIEYFAEFDPATGAVFQCLAVERPYQGDFMEAGRSYIELPGSIHWSEQPTPTAVLHVTTEGALEWVETAPLEHIRARAIMAIDAAAENLRLAVVNRMTMQSEEYRRVEAQARAWREAGYPEEEGVGAPRGVAGWAMAKWRDGWTNRQAADDILATADGWMHILDEVRDLRLANKEDVRHAAGADEIAAICADMRTDMRAMAAQLNLTLTE